MKKNLLAVFCIVFLFFSAAEVFADSFADLSDYLNSVYGPDPNAGLTAFPILKIPMGGRAQGMAEAFSSVADDVSFLDYNPAASSMLSVTELAFFHHNWIADANIEGAVFSTRYKDTGFAAGIQWLYVPFTEYDVSGEQVAKSYYSEAVTTLNISHNFLRSFHFSGIAAGANVKLAFRLNPDVTHANITYNQNALAIIPGSGWTQSALMVMTDLGVLTRFNFLKLYNGREQNASAALVIRNLGPSAFDDALPTELTAGISYKPLRPLVVSFDLSFPINLHDIDLSEKPYWALGFAAEATSFLSLRTGIQGRAGGARLTLGSSLNFDKVSLDVNYTLDLITQMQALNRVSLGLRFNLGDYGRAALNAKVTEMFLLGLAAYSRSDFATARKIWEEVLELDPGFSPAREGLDVMGRTGETEERILNMQNLDF